LKTTINGFLRTQFQIAECFPRCSIHCMNVLCFPVLMFHLNEHVNNIWRNRKTFLKRYSIALLLPCEDFLHVSVFHKRVRRTLHDSLYPFHPQCVQNLHLTVPCI
jgi:hypothetical protein